MAIQFCFNSASTTISVSVGRRSNNIPRSQPPARLNLDSPGPNRNYKSMKENLVEFTRLGQGKIRASSRQGQGKVEEWIMHGQSKVKVRSRQGQEKSM